MAASSLTSNDQEKHDDLLEKHDMLDKEKSDKSDRSDKSDKSEPAAEATPDAFEIQPQQAGQPSEWSGPDDPEDPMNWSTAKKAYHSAIPSVYCFTVTFASSVYTPGIPKVQQKFHVSTTVAILPLSLYVLGTAFGPMIAAPLSETLGRRAVYFSCLPIFSLFIIGAGFSKTFASLVVCRFFAGVFGSPPLSVGAGTAADLFPSAKRGLVTAFFILAPFLGPVLGPVIGGFVVEKKDWQWTQWTLLFFVAASMLLSVGMKETYKKTLLERRAKSQGIVLQKTGPQGVEALKFLLTVTLFRPIRMLFVEPIVAFFSLYVAFNMGVVFGFFDAFPIVFAGVYHFNSGQDGLTFLGLGVGFCLGVATFLVVDRFTYQKHYDKSLRDGRGGAVLPEHRLYSAMMGSIALPISLFWFAWTAKIHWQSPVFASIPFAWGNFLVFSSAALYLIDTYGALYGASAMAANGLLRYVLSSAFPLFTVQREWHFSDLNTISTSLQAYHFNPRVFKFRACCALLTTGAMSAVYTALGIPWATSLFAFIALALLPVPWVLFKWGPQIRAMSHYETTKIGVPSVGEA